MLQDLSNFLGPLFAPMKKVGDKLAEVIINGIDYICPVDDNEKDKG